MVAPLALAVLTAAALLLHGRGVDLSRIRTGPLRSVRRRRAAVVAHTASLALFWVLTAAVFEGGRPHGVLVLAWASCGLLVPATLVPLATDTFPIRVLGPAAWRITLAAVVLGPLAWGAGQLTAQMWGVLRHGTFAAVVSLLDLSVGDAFARPQKFILGTRRFWVEIAPGCSGYEGIGLITVFLAAYLWLFRRSLRLPRALILLPIGATAAWLANVLRITALVLVGTFVSPELALGGFHSYLGSLLFCVLALGLAVLAGRWPWLARGDGPASALPAPAHEELATPYLGPLLAILAATLLGGVVSPDGFDAFYPARPLAAVAVLWVCRHRYAELQWSVSPLAVAAGIAVFLLWIALEPPIPDLARRRAIAEGLAALPAAGAALWLAARAIGHVLVVPVAEELAFRGYVTRRVLAADVGAIPLSRLSWRGLLVSSLLFGLLHQQLLAGTLAGLVYGLVLSRRGRLGDAVVAHAVTNALLAGWVLGTGAWELW